MERYSFHGVADYIFLLLDCDKKAKQSKLGNKTSICSKATGRKYCLITTAV